MAKETKGAKKDKDKGKDKKASKKQAKAAKKAEKKAAKKVAKTPPFRAITPSLTASDVEASLKFYSALGFVVIETWKNDAGSATGYELRAGKTDLMIGQDDFAKGRDRKKGDGLRFYFLTKEKVDDVATRMKAAGYALASEPADQRWGARTFNLADPDGFNVTISSSW